MFAPGFLNPDFRSEDNICLIPKSLYNQDSYSFGDSILLFGEYIPENYHVDPHDGLEQFTKGIPFEIVGTYDVPNEISTTFRAENIIYIVPARTILNNIHDYFIYDTPPKELYYKNMHEIISEAFTIRAEFTLKNTKQIGAFKNYLIQNKLLGTIQSDESYTFYVYDEYLTSSTVPLLNSIAYKENLQILIFLLVCVIHFFIAMLFCQKKAYDIALMRIMGTSKTQIFFYGLIEHFIIAMIGTILAFFVLMISYNTYHILNDVITMTLYLASILMGSTIGILIIMKMNTIHILLQKE